MWSKLGQKSCFTMIAASQKLCLFFPPLQQYLRLKKENPAEFSLCRACFLAYEDLHTDVFPLFWGLIIPIFGPKSLCMGIIDDKTEVKLTPLYYG